MWFVCKTKLTLVTPAIVFETLGGNFVDFYFLAMEGTRGGILLACRGDMIALANPIIGTYHVSATVTSLSESNTWWLTGVYGPQGTPDKLVFLSELHDLRDSIAGPWVIGDDSNMVTSIADKNNGRFNHRTMNQF